MTNANGLTQDQWKTIIDYTRMCNDEQLALWKLLLKTEETERQLKKEAQ